MFIYVPGLWILLEMPGRKEGVQKAQISRMERSYSISIPTMSRAFKALEIATVTLVLGPAGKGGSVVVVERYSIKSINPLLISSSISR